MKRIALVLLVFLVIGLSGCPEIQPKKPKELYKELAEKGKELPNGKFSYTMKMDLGSDSSSSSAYASALLGGLSYDIDIFKLNEKTKTLINMSLLGTSMTMATFELGEDQIVCIESPTLSSISPSSEGITCQKGGQESYASLFNQGELDKSFEDYLDKIDLALTGDKKYAGRNCYNFKIKIDEDTLKEMTEKESKSGSLFSGSYTLSGAKAEYDICLDKEHGFTSYIKANFSRYSELAEKETKLIGLEMELKEFDPNGAKEKDFKIPVNFGLDEVKCDNEKINFKLNAFNPVSGEVRVKVGKIDYMTREETIYLTKTVNVGNLKMGDEKEVEIENEKELESGSYTVVVCPKEGECVTGNCYYHQSYDEEYNKLYEQTIKEDECTDSDGGKNYSVKGTVTYSGNGVDTNNTDFCSTPQPYLMEYYCEDNLIQVESFECPNSCEDGACS